MGRIEWRVKDAFLQKLWPFQESFLNAEHLYNRFLPTLTEILAHSPRGPRYHITMSFGLIVYTCLNRCGQIIALKLQELMTDRPIG